MKYFASSIILVASTVALPGRAAQANSLATRSPVAAAFAEAFPSFNTIARRQTEGPELEDDINVFCRESADTAAADATKAMKLRRDADAAADFAAVKSAMSSRSEFVRRQTEGPELEDDINVFCRTSGDAAESASVKARQAKRDAEAAADASSKASAEYTAALQRRQESPQLPEDDVNIFCRVAADAADTAATKAKMLKREADAAAEAESEAYAVHAMALKIRQESPNVPEDDVNIFCRAQAQAASDAEAAASKLKREADAAANAAAESEATYVKALKIRAGF